MTTPPSPRRRGRPARDQVAPSRDALLERALALFAAHGYDGVSLRQLARELRVSDPLLIHHFGSKEGLWRAAVELAAARAGTLLRANLLPGADPLTRVLDSIAATLRLAAAGADVLRLAFREEAAGGPRAEELRRRFLLPYLAAVDRVLAEAVAEGLAEPVNLAALHAMVLGAVRALALETFIADRMTAGADPRAAYVAGVVDLLRRSLARRPPP
jgi:TetR/AcrR family transcriptional regulator